METIVVLLFTLLTYGVIHYWQRVILSQRTDYVIKKSKVYIKASTDYRHKPGDQIMNNFDLICVVAGIAMLVLYAAMQ